MQVSLSSPTIAAIDRPSDAIDFYEVAISTNETIASNYWHLEIAYLLAVRADDAQTDWFTPLATAAESVLEALITIQNLSLKLIEFCWQLTGAGRELIISKIVAILTQLFDRQDCNLDLVELAAVGDRFPPDFSNTLQCFSYLYLGIDRDPETTATAEKDDRLAPDISERLFGSDPVILSCSIWGLDKGSLGVKRKISSGGLSSDSISIYEPKSLGNCELEEPIHLSRIPSSSRWIWNKFIAVCGRSMQQQQPDLNSLN